MKFDKELLVGDNNTLKINYSGFKNDCFNSDELKMSIYAFNKHSGDPVFSETLGYSQIQTLFNHLNSVSIIRDNGKTVSNKFVELNEDNFHLLSFIENINSNLVKAILSKIIDEEKQKILLDVLSVTEIHHLNAAIKQKEHQKALEDLLLLLALEKNGILLKI